MTSVSTILESVGINYVDLASQVAESRRISRNTDPAPADHFPVEALACAIEQLAARLVEVADDVSHGLGDYYVGDMAADVIDVATGRDCKDAFELVRSHLGDEADAELTSSPVFGHPELRCVNHTVLDHTNGTFTLTSYLVDVRSGDVTPAPGGPMVGTAALA